MLLSDVRFLAIARNFWGLGATPKEALKKLRLAGAGRGRVAFQMFIVHKDTFVAGIGSVNYPLEHEPIEIERRNIEPGKEIVKFTKAGEPSQEK